MKEAQKTKDRIKFVLLGIIPLIILFTLITVAPPNVLELMPNTTVPIEDLTFERIVLEPNLIKIEVTNGGPNDIELAQILINDALYSGYIDPSDSISRLGKAKLYIPYSWVENEPINITIISSNSIKFEHEIEAAVSTPKIGLKQLSVFTMIGTYVGVIPVYLGLLWLPFLNKLDKKWNKFILSITVGLLLFLGIDTFIEAIETSALIPSSFQGQAIIVIGIITSFLVLQSIGEYTVNRTSNKVTKNITLAYLIALGIGLHNFGEGLAIGSAYALGEISLGAFLIIGFTIHNITEGVAIVSPLTKKKIKIQHLVILGIIGGIPTIFGTIIGGLAYTGFWATLFLSIATGAIFQVIYEVSKYVIEEGITGLSKPMNLLGLIIGLLIMYATGLII